MREEKLRRLGASPSDAEAEARARFGDPGQVRDECVTIDQRYAREVRVMEWIESVWSDFRYAFRTLRRMPAFTLVATLTLALGIGATTAMFTLVDEILLRPLPYPDADRIVRLIQSYPEIGLDTWGVSQENIAMYRDRATRLRVVRRISVGWNDARGRRPRRAPRRGVGDRRLLPRARRRPGARPPVHARRGHEGKQQRRHPQRRVLAVAIRRTRRRDRVDDRSRRTDRFASSA